MMTFRDMFTVEFFINFAFAALSMAGLVLAVSYRRVKGTKASLFLLLTAALMASYFTIQWVLNSFVVFFLNNYWVNHPDFQLASWVSTALNVLGLVLNYGFVIMLGLTTWSAIRQARQEAVAPCVSETAVVGELDIKGAEGMGDEAASSAGAPGSGSEEEDSSDAPHTGQEG
ncbi:MAG TPA: hypothetical protein VIN62_02735 [Candidatus Cryosericum sp.]